MATWLELSGKILSFLGGCFLTMDALTPARRIRSEAGLRYLQSLLEKAGAGDLLKDSQGRSLGEEQTLQLLFSRRASLLARIGFVLVTLGFLLDMLAQAWKI